MKKIAYLISVMIFIASHAYTQTQQGQQPQMVTVSGAVKDKADSSALPSANILILNEKNRRSGGVSTDEEGKFSLRAGINYTLKVSFLGYDTVYYKVKGATDNLTLMMQELENIIDEVVIIGYQEKKMGEVTASVAVVNAEDLVKTPVSNVMELLQGRVPGLNIQLNNGLPGMQGTYNVRGVSDIATSGSELIPSTPLFVVDGIPQEDVEYDPNGLLTGSGISPLSFIPVEDIDNIQILRDAAATAMYGSKGAYGVILINTRKGSSASGKPVISYSANLKINTPPRLRDVVAGRYERMARINEIMQNDTSYMHALTTVNSNPFLSDSLNAYYNNNTDWQDVFYRITYNQTHNLNFSGGDSRLNYKVNASVYDEEGIITNTNFNTYSIRTGMGYRPNDRFTISTNVNAGISLNSSGSGSLLEQTGVATGANTTSLLPPPSLYTSSSAILGVLAVDDSKVTLNYEGIVNMSYRLPWKQDISGSFGYKYNSVETEKFTPGMLNSNIAINEGFSSNTSTLYARVQTGYTVRWWLFNVGLNVGGDINWKNSIGNTIVLSGLTGDMILGPIGYRPNASSGSANSTASDATVMFRFNPSFGIGKPNMGSDKYVFTPGINPERNSSYGSKAKWMLNPILGFRWNFSAENFMKKQQVLTYGAFRVSWGRSTRYNATIYDIWGSYLLDQGTYGGYAYMPADLNKLPNASLKPVTSTQWNLGTDLSFLKGKLTLTSDAYYKQIDNQLSNVDIANHNAYSYVRTTEISIVNYGLEFALGVKPLPSKSPFYLHLNFNMAINRDVTAKLPNNARQITSASGSVVNRVGSNTMTYNLWVYKGVYERDEDVPVDPVTGKRLRVGGNTTKEAYFRAGDPIWVDVNGDYIIDNNDRVLVGNSQPRITGGINFNFGYKDIHLSVNTSYIIRRDIINKALSDRFKTYANPLSQTALVPIGAYNFWTPQNAAGAAYPNPHDYTRSAIINPFRAEQTLFMEDGSYYKINSVSMSYTIPKVFSARFGVSSVRFSASVNNIYTFSNYSGINPESVSSLGYDNSGGYPNARNWALTMNVQF
jgi:TonB-linked SusC/RagA family outer membrane protein